MPVSHRRSEAELLLSVQMKSQAAIVSGLTGRNVLIRIRRAAECRRLSTTRGD